MLLMGVRAMVIKMILFAMFKMSDEVTWTTENSSTECCEGDDKLLMWEYSMEENESVIELKWFYNMTSLISQYSESRGFRVTPSYKGRIEHRGKTGILLKQVSSDDTGEYTLYTKLAGMHTQNYQTLFLSVYEPPTQQCKPSISIYSENILSCSTNSCGRYQLSPEWRLFGKGDPVSNKTYLKIESSWKYEHLYCCPQGPNMKCHNGDTLMFCVSTLSVSTEENIPDNGDIPDKKASDFSDTDMKISLILVASFSAFVLIVVICLAVVCCYRKLKLRKLYSEWLEENMIQGPRVVNNINIDSDVLKSLLDSEWKLRDSRKENTKHIRQSGRKKHSIQLQKGKKCKDPSGEMTMTLKISVKTDGIDTDTSDEITDGTDANLDAERFAACPYKTL